MKQRVGTYFFADPLPFFLCYEGICRTSLLNQGNPVTAGSKTKTEIPPISS